MPNLVNERVTKNVSDYDGQKGEGAGVGVGGFGDPNKKL